MADNVLKQISLVESLDSRTSEEAIQSLKELISEGVGIPQLVQHYVKCQSNRALELLTMVQEPYDWIMLDSLLEYINENELEIINLLEKIVQKAPSWLPKFPYHSIFSTILEKIQLTENLGFISATILLIVSVLPYCSTMTESILDQVFYAFLKACRVFVTVKENSLKVNMDKIMTSSNTVFSSQLPTNRQIISKDQTINSDIQLRKSIFFLTDSIKFALLKFFQMLYSLYPWSFVNYLRKIFTKLTISNDKLDIKLFKTIEELLLTVRFHPDLIKNEKNLEFCRERWMTHEAHDFFSISQEMSVISDSNEFFSNNFYNQFDEGNSDETFENEINNEISMKNILKNIFPDNLDEQLQPNSATPNMHFNLETPPNGPTSETLFQSVKNNNLINTAVALNKKDQNNISTSVLNNSKNTSFLLKIGQIFKPKKNIQSDICLQSQSNDYSQDIQNIEEYHGICTTNNILGASLSSRNFELATECTENFECNDIDYHVGECSQFNYEKENKNERPSSSRIYIQRKSSAALNRLKDSTIKSKSENYSYILNKLEVDENKHSKNKVSVLSIATRKLSKTSSLSELEYINEKSLSFFETNKSIKNNLIFCANCMKEVNVKSHNLRLKFEHLRQKYISASNSYHLKLKDLDLAYCFPDRIYDDIQYLINGLSLDKQCEILLARLRLVNQHLLFERYCRYLHETRNRRLFGKLKQQRTIQTDYEVLKRSEHMTSIVLEKQLDLCNQLRNEVSVQKNANVEIEKQFSHELLHINKENENLSIQLKNFQNKIDRLNQLYKKNKLNTDKILLSNENLKAERKLEKLELKKMQILQEELLYLQHKKNALEDELKTTKAASKTNSRQRAEEMIAPLYEAQLKNLRQQLRKTKTSLNRAMEKNRLVELQWKEELDRRLDLQSALTRASNIHSKTMEAAQHKFNTLLSICNKQEAHIFNLYRALESQASTHKSDLINSEKTSNSNDNVTGSPKTASANVSLNSQTIPIPQSNTNYPISCDSSYIFMNVEARKKISDLFSTSSNLTDTAKIDQNEQNKDLKKSNLFSVHSTDINNQTNLNVKSQNAHSSTNFDHLLKPEPQVNKKKIETSTKLSSSFPDNLESALSFVSQKH